MVVNVCSGAGQRVMLMDDTIDGFESSFGRAHSSSFSQHRKSGNQLEGDFKIIL